jgi:hypothetical protein
MFILPPLRRVCSFLRTLRCKRHTPEEVISADRQCFSLGWATPTAGEALQAAAGPEASENVPEVPGKTRVQKLRAIKRAPTLMSRR